MGEDWLTCKLRDLEKGSFKKLFCLKVDLVRVVMN